MGCLAHADITTVEGTGEVVRVMGYFEHNQACQQSVLVRFPAVPLHPHVIEVAMLQFRAGAKYVFDWHAEICIDPSKSISQVRNKNLEMFASQLYRDQRGADRSTANVRYELQSGDFSRLYRQHYRQHYGINVSVTPECNIDNWLDQTNGQYKPEIAQSVFYYTPHIDKTDCFIVCIATPEMKAAAWRYCHHQQVILDGTFRVCTSRLLLWIAMGVDESRSGVPVALFLFSAPTGNRATHAGYNTDIITELLSAWREWMGKRDSDGVAFEPFVGMTDTDTKERAALLRVWPAMVLLLCKFHVCQCWTNKRGTLLGKLPPFWKVYLENCIRALEEA